MKSIKRLIKIATSKLLFSYIYIPFIYNEMEQKEYHLRVILGHVLVRCSCTKYERNMLEALSNIEVFEDTNQTPVYLKYIAVLTVNFPVFQHVCIYEKFPDSEINKIKIRL